MELDPCLARQVGRRRIFWTTQPQACGDYEMCGRICAIAGLEYDDTQDPNHDGSRTIKNTDWIQSLVLNILNTRARTDQKCVAPFGVFGHWSESYRQDNLYIGSTLWNAASKKYIRINDAVNAIGAAIKADVSKLVALGVATEVTVQATYSGGMTVQVLVIVTTSQNTYTIKLSGVYATDTWVWS